MLEQYPVMRDQYLAAMLRSAFAKAPADM